MSTAVASPLFSDAYFDSDVLSPITNSNGYTFDYDSLAVIRKKLDSINKPSHSPLQERFSLGGLFSRLDLNGSGSPTNEHRKLDRSLSEPVDRQQQPQKANPTNSSRYKTELCRPFEENGTCKYGDKCQFAHGHHEIRNLTRHPKYKTELCRTFHSSGFCPYGPRCHFIHNPNESRKSSSSSSASSCANSQSSSPPPQNPGSLQRQSIRPKDLSVPYNSVSSTGDHSPSSSLSGSPTTFGTFFDDSSVFSPKTPVAQNAFSFSNDFSVKGLPFIRPSDVIYRPKAISKKSVDELFFQDLGSPLAMKRAQILSELKRLDDEANNNSINSKYDFGLDEGSGGYALHSHGAVE